MSQLEPAKTGAERRKRKRAMFAVPVQIRGGVGTLEVFEDIVSSLDVSRDGLLLATSRGGYSVGQKLHVCCPYWAVPTSPSPSQVRVLCVESDLVAARALRPSPIRRKERVLDWGKVTPA